VNGATELGATHAQFPLTGDPTPRTQKAPPCGAFARCAEEDSNLHPVIPDQALNSGTRASFPPNRAKLSELSGSADDIHERIVSRKHHLSESPLDRRRFQHRYSPIDRRQSNTRRNAGSTVRDGGDATAQPA
jgi:hypothetical protein